MLKFDKKVVMNTKHDPGSIEGIKAMQIKDNFGNKSQKYFRTMVLSNPNQKNTTSKKDSISKDR